MSDVAARLIPNLPLRGLDRMSSLAASVYAAMVFPEDGGEAKRDRFRCTVAIGLDWHRRFSKADVHDLVPVSGVELASLFELFERHSTEALQRRAEEGECAGNLLRLMLWMSRDERMNGASVSRAAALLPKFVGMSSTDVMACWSRYRSVSHLWAAWAEMRQLAGRAIDSFGHDQKQGDLHRWIQFMNNPSAVLTFAYHYQAWGLGHRPKHSKLHTTLVASESWTPPADAYALRTESFFRPEQLYQGLADQAADILLSIKERQKKTNQPVQKTRTR